MTAAPKAVVRFILRNGKRIAVSIAGAVLLLAGLVMMITPGPGLVFILAGLAVLGSEYAWAQRALDRTKAKAKDAGRGVRRWFRRKKD